MLADGSTCVKKQYKVKYCCGATTTIPALLGLSLLCSKIFRLFFFFFSPIIPKIMLTIFMIPAHNLHTMYRFHCL